MATSDATILQADGLTMSYDGTTVLQGLTFELRRGRIMGFLGPNGAGKTTSIRILTTILRPSSGRFTVAGIGSDQPARIRPLIGVLPETLGLPNQVTGIEYISYFARLYGLRGEEARRHGLDLLQLVGLRDRARSLIRTYSHGMRQRLGLARALVNDPAVLFLDEPTMGLDPRGQQELAALLREIASTRGAGIILCSHALTEVEVICDDVVILSKGRVVAAGSVPEVLERARARSSGKEVVHIRVRPEAAAQAAQLLGSLEGVSTIDDRKAGGALTVALATPEGAASSDDGRRTNEVVEALTRSEIPLLGFEIEGWHLQDAFMQLTEGAGR